MAGELGTLSDPGLPPWPYNLITKLELAKIPVKTHLFAVRLLHLDKTGLDMNLRGNHIKA